MTRKSGIITGRKTRNGRQLNQKLPFLLEREVKSADKQSD
jgi:hypothetical protein